MAASRSRIAAGSAVPRKARSLSDPAPPFRIRRTVADALPAAQISAWSERGVGPRRHRSSRTASPSAGAWPNPSGKPKGRPASSNGTREILVLLESRPVGQGFGHVGVGDPVRLVQVGDGPGYL